MQTSDIVQRQFIIKDGHYRHCTPQEHAAADKEKGDRPCSCFSIFVPAFDPEATKRAFEQRAFRYVDVQTSQEPAGVWLFGGHCWLEKVVASVQERPAEV